MGRRATIKAPRRNGNYPPLHILSLPIEIILGIIGYLRDDITSLLQLALTCSRFNSVILKMFLYELVQFKSVPRFIKFAHAHLPQRASPLRFVLSEPSSRINFIRSVHFVNPPMYDDLNPVTTIAGSYSVFALDPGIDQYKGFVRNLQLLLSEAYGLKELKISEILPQFKFSSEFLETPITQAIKLRFKSRPPARTLEKLCLSAQSGWSIPFRVDHVSLFVQFFGEIGTLELQNFVINDAKLINTSSPPLNVEQLLLTACTYSKQLCKKTCLDTFGNTSFLGLESIQHMNDLCLIDAIKANGKLARLSIDISSSIFYQVDPADNSWKFQFSKYNNFFKLLCSGKGNYGNLKQLVLTHFDLFHTMSHQHNSGLDTIQEEEEEEAQVVPPEEDLNTFEYFMSHLSQIPVLTIVMKKEPMVIHTCRNCGFTVTESSKRISSLREDEWSRILQPLISNNDCQVSILDHRLQLLFQRSPQG